ncbi:hypothetical protein CYY_005978 [Polysphondylium violaceum]|uniref:Uncharacterized protein n=1 Tax=Polysphondylium violaceum TaxID=133409 RepID=A0A8J4PS11_9MYCE|nr:hypothetical protein CYY_005978 [Polysphondylium violaceum]
MTILGSLQKMNKPVDLSISNSIISSSSGIESVQVGNKSTFKWSCRGNPAHIGVYLGGPVFYIIDGAFNGFKPCLGL